MSGNYFSLVTPPRLRTCQSRNGSSDAAALHYAEIRAVLKRRGAMIGANDLFIAAHARASGLTLVTNNTAEFERVSDLKIENWTQPLRRKR